MLFEAYQDRVHQNTRNNMDGDITEDGKLKTRRKRLVCMPTQRYNAPSGKFGRIFVGTLSVKIDGVPYRKLNSERVIFFQSVILQRAQGINNAKHIRARIFFRIDFWNHGAFDELVKYALKTDTG